ncbi:hypothetical protein ScPMuIL_006387 [Solemya velum]
MFPTIIGSEELANNVTNQPSIELYKLDGGKVGDVKELLLNNVPLQMKTLSLEPLLFEIPNFLSSDECAHHIEQAKKTGLVKSDISRMRSQKKGFPVFNTDDNDVVTAKEMKMTIEHSMDIYLEEEDVLKIYNETGIDLNKDGIVTVEELKQTTPNIIKTAVLEFIQDRPEKQPIDNEFTFPYQEHTDEMYQALRDRVGEVTQLSPEIFENHFFKVLKFGKDGFSNGHFGSDSARNKTPCCTNKKDVEGQEVFCRICRYVTVQIFLNDVEEGGETVFPLASNGTVDIGVLREQGVSNIYKSCDAKLKIKPELGKAVIWYNHFIDPESKSLGDMDRHTFNGVCKMVSDEQWVGIYSIDITEEMRKRMMKTVETAPKDEL